VFYCFTYLRTRDEHDATNPLKPLPDLPYLKWLLNTWHTGPKLQYVAKSRQLMVSWLLCAYALWTIQFRPYALVLLQSKKEEDTAPFIYEKSPEQARISLMVKHLPEWLKVCKSPTGGYVPFGPEQTMFSYCNVILPNGSSVEGIPQGAAQVEGKVPTLFLGDECSLQSEWRTAIAAAKPAIAGDARAICVGTMRQPSDYGEEIAPCADVDPDGVMRGVAEFRSLNDVYSVRVHYTADPGKDPATPAGAAWKQEQLSSGAYRGGEKGWHWQQHMEINPLSRAGTLCIPMFRDIEHRIIIPNLTLNQMHNWSFDAGLDWGVRNHTVFLVFGMSPEGRRYMVYEFSQPAGDCGGIPGVCRIIKSHPLFKAVDGNIHADRSMFRQDENATGGLTTKAQIFAENGVNLVKCKEYGQPADEVALDRLINYYWAGWERPDFDPLLYITRSCTQTLKHFPLLMYEEWSEALAAEKSLKEKMKDLHTDQWDAFKYAEVAWPDYPKYQPGLQVGTLAWHKQRAKRFEQRAGSGNLWERAKT
jgi:hypothetical protein